MIDSVLTLGFIAALCAAAAWQYLGSKRRSQSQVVEQLFAEAEMPERNDQVVAGLEQFDFSTQSAALGLIKPGARRAFERKISFYPFIGALSGIAIRFMVFPLESPVSVTVAFTIFGLAIGYLVGQSAMRGQAHRWERRCQFCLPLTMERLVMGVQAGLDLIAALSVILKDERDSPTDDPVLELLSVVMKLTESGLPFEQALKEVGSRVPLTAIRHAFTHLAIAHREGGELVMPLKELSDATQSFYQETIEEEIARLPVKATLPLLCTFAGLIIFFLTSPLIQVISMTSGVTAGLK